MSSSRFIALLLALGTLAIYLPVAHYGFTVFDDPDYVYDNAMVRDGVSWAGIKWALTTWHASNWHPVTWLSHMLDCQLFGLNAGMHHVINVLFHTASVLLLFVLLVRWFGVGEADTGRALWPAVTVAALFAWHPLHVESVAWISERKDVLSTFFALSALLAYTRHVNKQSRVEGRGSKAARALDPRLWSLDYYLALLFFTLGLMAKPMLVTLPFVMLLLDYWPFKRVTGDGWRVTGSGIPGSQLLTLRYSLFEKWPFFLLAGVSCIVTFLAQDHGGMVKSLERVPWDVRLANVPVNYVHYLLKIFWPAHLAIFYPMLKIPMWTLAAALAVLAAISVMAWQLRGRQPYFIVGWLWFLGTLVPVIGLVQVGQAAISDRYTYFPSIGIFMALVLGIQAAARRWRLEKMAVGAAVLALAACLWLAHRQLGYWRSDIALFSHAIDAVGDNEPMRLCLGLAFEKAGQNDMAVQEYEAALKFNTLRARTYENLGRLLGESGQTAPAIDDYQKALKIDPGDVTTRESLGKLLVQAGRYEDAMKQYTVAAQLDPSDWHAPFLMGLALLRQNRDAEAIPCLQQSARGTDNFPALILLAQVLATDNDPKVRDGPAALMTAVRAAQLSENQPVALDTLAMAYAESGRFEEAIRQAQGAIDMAKNLGVTNDVQLVQQRLELYKNRQPFRQSFVQARRSP